MINTQNEDDFKFIFYKRGLEKLLLSNDLDTDKDLSEAIEKIAKNHGYLDQEDYPTPSSIILLCSEGNQWKYLSDNSLR